MPTKVQLLFSTSFLQSFVHFLVLLYGPATIVYALCACMHVYVPVFCFSSSGATIFSMFEEFVSHIAALEKQYAVEGMYCTRGEQF